MRITAENVEKVFSYHAPDEDQIKKYAAIRAQAKDFARTILEVVPECADRSVALRKLRECVMDVNAAIALDGEI